MSRDLRALTRSCLLRRVGSSLAILLRALPTGLLMDVGDAMEVDRLSLGGGEGLGIKEGTRGLSGTSGSLWDGGGEGILGVLPLICSTPTAL